MGMSDMLNYDMSRANQINPLLFPPRRRKQEEIGGDFELKHMAEG